MKTPEEALAAARSRAADAEGPAAPPSPEDPAAAAKRLAQWAIIEPDEAAVYSTRRLGGPITAFKRVLVRLLRQYFVQVNAQQSRFNADVAAHVMHLEERVGELEHRAGVGESDPREDSTPR